MNKFIKIFFKAISIVSLLVLIVVVYAFMHAFFVIDISKAPLEDELKEPVYLVSYADGPEVFHKNQKMLVYSGLKKGISHFFNYRKELIDPVFFEKNKSILTQKSGAGAWLWKPWVIMNTLKQVPENALVVYCDSGFVIKKNITPLLDLLKTNHLVLAAYTKEVGGVLGQLTKKEARIQTGCDTQACYNAPVIWAGMLFMRNTPVTRHFIQQWLNYCQQEDLILTHTKFKNQRHQYDQSLLGITYFKNPQGVVLVDGAHIGHNNILRWHHRNNPQVEKDSIMLKLDNGLRGWERKIIDSAIFQKIADWIYAFKKNPSSSPLEMVSIVEAEGRSPSYTKSTN